MIFKKAVPMPTSPEAPRACETVRSCCNAGREEGRERRWPGAQRAHPAWPHPLPHLFSGSKMIYRERERVLFVNFQER